MPLTKLQQEIREKMVVHALKTFKDDYHISNADIALIVGMSRQGIHKIQVKNGIPANTKLKAKRQ